MTIYINENIKRLRTEKGVTQEKLAHVLGVSFQSVSKWERGESYPDITFLPIISEFFNVSVDELLGIDKNKREKEITQELKRYDDLTDEAQMWQTLCELKDKYQGDFRIMLREMGYYVFYDDPFKNSAKIMSLYENIQHNCVDDTVRICSKRYIANYYKQLSEKEDSGVTFEECEKIIKQMPRLRDSREFLSAYLYPLNHPEFVELAEEYLEEAQSITKIMADHFRTMLKEKNEEKINKPAQDG